MKKGLIITGVVIVLMPIILNWVMRWQQIVPYVGEAKDWLTFWGDYLSAAVAAIMIIFTYYSLKNNKETLNEMKREWEEERKAQLIVAITANDRLIMIKVKNIGKMPAFNIQMTFNQEFIDSLFADNIRSIYSDLTEKRFLLEPGETKYFYLSPLHKQGRSVYYYDDKEYTQEQINKWLEQEVNVPIIVDATYNEREREHFETSLSNFFISNLAISDGIVRPLTSLSDAIVEDKDGNGHCDSIQKSLDTIARNIEGIRR